MKRFSFDKSSVLLIAIIAIVLALVVGLAIALGAKDVDQNLKSDRILNILVVVEDKGKPRTTELFLFYPATGKGALLDVPEETGLIIKSLNRVDRIDALYDAKRPNAYVEELERLLDTDIPYWIILDSQGLSSATDLLEGLELFIPQAIDDKGPPEVHLPSGALILDGDKVIQYSSYVNPDETEADRANGRQKLVQSFVKRLGERSAWLKRGDSFQAFRHCLRTNFSESALYRFFGELSSLDADRLLNQRITGLYRNVDGKQLLFPHYDGELVRDIVKQTLNALASSGQGGTAEKIYTVEILNGTPAKGLAKKTAEIFQSFGYDVVSVGNADREDYERTMILDRFSNPEAAKNVASVIRCSNLSEAGISGSQVSADFVVILGDDFNGRYCAK